MNVLFVTHHYLDGNGGGVYASRAFINAFAEISDNLTLLFPIRKGSSPEFISEKIELIPIHYEKPNFFKYCDLLVGHVHRYFDCFEKKIILGNYDMVVFDTSVVSFRLFKIAKKYNLKTITIHHNYQYEYYKDNCKFYTIIPTLYWTKKYEREAVNYSDLNLTLTDEDITLLRRNYVNNYSINFHRLGVFEFNKRTKILAEVKPEKNSYNKVFIITGNLSTVQTEISLNAWLFKYWPLLIKNVPNAKLIIAGKSPSKKIIKVCNSIKEIELISSPVNIQQYLDKADFYICPTELGGGIKLRIMDGLKTGLPVLSHAKSSRGYEVFIEKGCLVDYYNESTFVESLNKMLNIEIDSEVIKKIYVEQFSFNLGVERLKSALKDI